MADFIEYSKSAAIVLAGLTLFLSFFTRESDGAKLTARMLRALGLLLFAAVLHVIFSTGAPRYDSNRATPSVNGPDRRSGRLNMHRDQRRFEVAERI